MQELQGLGRWVYLESELRHWSDGMWGEDTADDMGGAGGAVSLEHGAAHPPRSAQSVGGAGLGGQDLSSTWPSEVSPRHLMGDPGAWSGATLELGRRVPGAKMGLTRQERRLVWRGERGRGLGSAQGSWGQKEPGRAGPEQVVGNPEPCWRVTSWANADADGSSSGGDGKCAPVSSVEEPSAEQAGDMA